MNAELWIDAEKYRAEVQGSAACFIRRKVVDVFLHATDTHLDEQLL